MDWSAINPFGSSTKAAPVIPANSNPPANTQQQPDPTQQQQQQQQQQPNQSQQPTNIQVDGLEAYKDLFKVQADPNTNQFDPSKLFNLDPKAIAQQVSGLNFTQGIAPELLQQAEQGGQAGVQAMMTAVNTAIQNSVANQTILTAQIVQQALGRTTPHLDQRMTSLIRDQQITQEVSRSNPLYSNPAVQPLIDMTRKQLATQYPNESPHQISQRVDQYVTALANSFKPDQVPTATANAKAEEQQWNNFFN